MAPDLNSLPPSRSTSASPLQARAFPPVPVNEPSRRETPSPRSASISSLAAAATLNAADRSSVNNGSPNAGRARERRRSTVAMNLNLNDPTLPAPGELASGDHRASIGSMSRGASPRLIGGDPNHHRTPSLGELHQELEQEQEAQVNRLLQMIRTQQAQLQQMQVQHQQHAHGSISSPLAGVQQPSMSTAIDDSTPTSERSFSLPTTAVPAPGTTTTGLTHRPSRPRRSSQSPSPALRNLPRPPSFLGHHESALTSASDLPSSPEMHPGMPPGLPRRTSRDEVFFYQAETANLTRENQMLRHRIKELEKMLSDASTGSSPGGGNTPVTPVMSASSAVDRAEGNAPAVGSGLSREVSGDDIVMEEGAKSVG